MHTRNVWGGGQTDNYIRLLIFYILALVIIILFFPRLGEVLFWRTGVTNYWWAAGLLLLAGLPLREYVGHERIERLENTRWKIIIFAMLSFAAGFTNENNVCVFLFLYFCTIAYDLVKYRRIKAWTIINTVFMGLGYFILLTCHSTRHRIEYYNSVYGVHGTFLENAVRRIPDVIGTYFQVSCLILILQALAFIIFITAYFINSWNEPVSRLTEKLYKTADVFGFYAASLLAAAAIVGSPYIEPRAYLLCNIFSIICICFCLESGIGVIRNSKKAMMKRHAKALAITGAVIALAVFCAFCVECHRIYTVYHDYHEFTDYRNSLMAEARESGKPTQWPVYDFQNSRELNTREDYIAPQPDTIERYFGIKLKKPQQ